MRVDVTRKSLPTSTLAEKHFRGGGGGGGGGGSVVQATPVQHLPLTNHPFAPNHTPG